MRQLVNVLTSCMHTQQQYGVGSSTSEAMQSTIAVQSFNQTHIGHTRSQQAACMPEATLRCNSTLESTLYSNSNPRHPTSRVTTLHRSACQQFARSPHALHTATCIAHTPVHADQFIDNTTHIAASCQRTQYLVPCRATTA